MFAMFGEVNWCYGCEEVVGVWSPVLEMYIYIYICVCVCVCVGLAEGLMGCWDEVRLRERWVRSFWKKHVKVCVMSPCLRRTDSG